jgi:hypothetical protein
MRPPVAHSQPGSEPLPAFSCPKSAGSAIGWTTGTHAIAIAYRLKSQSAFPLEVHSIDPPHRKRPHRPRRNGGDIEMFNPKIAGRCVGRRLVLAGIVASSTLAASTAVLAGECPADKFKADVRQPRLPRCERGYGYSSRRNRSGKRAGEARGAAVATAQAHCRAWRHCALAQPWRPSGSHLHRGRRDRRIRQQLFRSNRPQGRRCRKGDERHIALVAEQQHHDCYLVLKRRSPRQERQAHVIGYPSNLRDARRRAGRHAASP